MKKIKASNGFTLIELMIVIAIIGIIAAIAYPSYKNSVNKAQRTDAKVSLLKMAGLQEKYFTQNGSYAEDFLKLKVTVSSSTTADSDEGLYTVTVSNPSCSTTVGSVTRYSCFLLSATPKTGQGQVDDTDCWIMSLSQTGLKSGAKKGGGVNGACW